MIPISRRKRIVHVVYSFSIGGLENVIVQLINRLPADRFEHVVVSLTIVSEFRNRVSQSDVKFIALNKPPGHAIPLYPRIFALLRELRPDVIHTCNLAALEIQPLAWLARIPLRIHAEHGWDVHDPKGTNPRYRRVRKLYRPFVSHYVSVSREIHDYLGRAVGIAERRRSLIPNGVDTELFSPATDTPRAVPGCPFVPGDDWLIGTIGRLQTVKNQPFLARAFVRLIHTHSEAAKRLRLVIIGEGPLRAEVEKILNEGGVSAYAWLPGARDDVADILRMLNCFVLPSQSEGTSCTLQEAMASGLPVVATAVGGTPDLVEEGVTGHLVAPDDDSALADAIWRCYVSPQTTKSFGYTARRRALENFALDNLVTRYERLFGGASDTDASVVTQHA